jgi:hypothetical protein
MPYLNRGLGYTKLVFVLSDHHSSAAKQQIIERIKSMVFLCMYCNNKNPISPALVDFEYHGSGPHGGAFFICPECCTKFMLKIEDLGKIR